MSIKGPRNKFFGHFDFILEDKRHRLTTSSMSQAREFLLGGQNTFVFYTGQPEMEKIRQARIGWYEHTEMFCFFGCKRFINVDRVTIASLNSRTKKSQVVTLCPKDDMTEIITGEFQEFFPCKK